MLACSCTAPAIARPVAVAAAKHVSRAHILPARRRVLPVTWYKGQTAEAPSGEGVKSQWLPYDCTELLNLHGRPSFLLCDITKAYETLSSMPLVEGYSAALVRGRAEVLAYVKDLALDNEGAVGQEDARGIELPLDLLPSALALLAQLNQNATVYELAEKLLQDEEIRAAFGRDLLLSVVVAHCNIARDLLMEQNVAEGCCVLEEGLARLEAAGQPPLAPGLAADMRAALDSLAVDRIRDQFAPGSAAEPSARAGAVALLRSLLTTGGSGGGHARSPVGGPLRALFGGGAGDSVAASTTPGGGAVAAAVAAASSLTPGIVREVVDTMSSGEVVGMADWDQVARRAGSTPWLYPGLLQVAASAHLATALVSQHVEDARTALALAKAAPSSCEVLLLRGVAHMLLGDPQAAAAAIKAAASAPPDDAYKLPGRGLPLRDTEAGGEASPGVQLPPSRQAADFVARHSQPDDEPPLLTGLFIYADTFLQQAVLPGFPDTARLRASLADYLDNAAVQEQLTVAREHSASLVGNLSAVKDAVMSVKDAVPPLVQQLAATAGGRLGGLGQGAHEQGRRPSAAAAALEGLQQRLGGRWPAAAVAGAALAAVVIAASLGRPSGRAASQRHQHQRLAAAPAAQQLGGGAASSSAAAAAAVASAPLTKASATKLLKRFQAAKAAALGSNFDGSQLADVCCGAALGRFRAMCEEWASRGWFRTATVWKNEVVRVAPLSPSGLRVLVAARVGERAETWGIDGQRGSAWSNEYDVDYEVVLCHDLQWRIERVTVRGQEPGMPGWFGVGGLLGGVLGGRGGSSSST